MKEKIKYQLELFCLSLSFFSRIPVPVNTPYSEERMNRSGRYFALVGTLLGLLCGLAYLLCHLLFPAHVAVLLSMAFSLLLTGAFHEDGLTDMADGIGGAMVPERRLSIMKDSRIGTYGAATLVMVLLSKYVLLTTLATQLNLLLVFVMAYTLSRAIAASLIYDMPYVSESSTSKSKPLANSQRPQELAFLLVCALVSASMAGVKVLLVLLICTVVFRVLFKRWLTARIGGFTGDCLGAAQQLMEMIIYLVLVAFYCQ